jgi:hypothetical protein
MNSTSDASAAAGTNQHSKVKKFKPLNQNLLLKKLE